MERNVNNDKRLKPQSHNDLHCWGGGCRLKTHSQSGNYPCDYKVFPYYLEATTRHSERSEESNRKLNQESKNIICHPEQTQCPKDLRVSKEILARDVGEATSRTYRDTRKGTVIPLLQNDDLTCHPVAITRHSERKQGLRSKVD